MIELQPFGRDDFLRLIGWVPDARSLMTWAGPIFHYPLDVPQLETCLEGAQGETPKRRIWKGVDRTCGGTIGHIEIDRIDRAAQSGVLSRVLIGETSLRGRGLGRELVAQAVTRGFDELVLKEISLAVFDFNASAIRCYQAIGFRQFDEKKQAVRIGDEAWTVLFMRIRRNEWTPAATTQVQPSAIAHG
jgi:RimJ/RimL family protein N-acetyltransferase